MTKEEALKEARSLWDRLASAMETAANGPNGYQDIMSIVLARSLVRMAGDILAGEEPAGARPAIESLNELWNGDA